MNLLLKDLINLRLPLWGLMRRSQTAAKIQQIAYQTDLYTARCEQGLEEGFELCKRHWNNIQSHFVICSRKPNTDSECFGCVGVDTICNE